MRIAFVYDALYPWVHGGGERRYYELGRRLADSHDVHFVSWQWWEGPARLRRDGVTLHGVGRPPRLYGRDGKRTVREALAFSARVMPVLLRNRWDVIDCSATPYLPLHATWLTSRLTGTPLIATWHEFWGEHWNEYLPDRPLVARVARRLEAGGRRLGDRVIAVSDFTARAMGMTGDPRLEVVPNGVARAGIAAAKPAADVADLLFVGRLIDDKRVDLLLGAVGLLSGRFPSLRCSVVGDGPQLPVLRRQVSDLGIEARVHFHRRVTEAEVPRLLRAAKVLVLPSMREGYGLVVAEAQAAGAVPIVVRSPRSGAPDLVRDGIDGLVVDPTAESLAGGIASLLADEERLDTMSKAAYRAGAARDWDLMATQIERVYRQIAAPALGKRRPKRLRWS